MSRDCTREMRLVSKEAARELRSRQTPTEECLWSALRNRKLDGWKFLRQHPVLVEFEGKETFVVADFYCAAGKLIVEVDGIVHDSKREYDAARDSLLNSMGYRVIRFSNDEVEIDCESILLQIKKVLLENAKQLVVSPNTPSLLRREGTGG